MLLYLRCTTALLPSQGIETSFEAQQRHLPLGKVFVRLSERLTNCFSQILPIPGRFRQQGTKPVKDIIQKEKQQI